MIAIEIPSIFAGNRWRSYTVAKSCSVISGALIFTSIMLSDDKSRVALWRVQSWAAIFIWIRFLLFLRTFSNFSWLINMILRTIEHSAYFLAVFFIGIIAMADSYLSINQILLLDGKVPRDELANPPVEDW